MTAGFILAVFIAWRLTVNNAITKVKMAVAKNSQTGKLLLYDYFHIR